MNIERTFELSLPGDEALLHSPEKVFGGRSPFEAMSREGLRLRGALVADVPLLGELRFPFESELVLGAGLAQLEPILPSPIPDYWAEIAGEGRVQGEKLRYEITVRLHAEVPPGDKWGGKALRRMAEAAFERTLSRALSQLQR
ncbi:DUF3809 family protein [Calidithermus timidus]|jgi:hypothetical protein|uniref:DUF3809 family protein n=1 Tax=Calidithermus timidus TaxID=307124 RepID=UPI000360583A|nr:DUF3809 family protein [Calidithermus timidus]